MFLLLSVEDVDLAFLRSREDIKHDKKEFLKDSEWELLSVSSTYNILQSNTGDFAQIQFNVGPSCSCCLLLCSRKPSLLGSRISALSCILILYHHPKTDDSGGSGSSLYYSISQTRDSVPDPGLLL